jgi:hypothetical protein
MNKTELHWLSFASEETGKNLGVVIVHANDIISAVIKAHRLGINPGGQVADFCIDGPISAEYLNRLLTPEEARVLAEKA